MDNLLVSLFLFVVIGVGIFMFDFFSNSLRKLEAEAEHIVCQRIKKLNNKKITSLLGACKSRGGREAECEMLLKRLLAIVGVSLDENKFEYSDNLSTIFRVSKNEFEGYEKTWRRSGLGNYIEVFSTEIIQLLDDLIEKEQTADILLDLHLKGASEDDIKDSIMAMDIGEFLVFFSKYMQK